MTKKKWIAGLGLGAAIAGGSLLLATVSPIGLAGAQDETDTTEEEASSDEETAPEARSSTVRSTRCSTSW